MTTAAASTYVYSNDDPVAPDHHRHLAAICDRYTSARLSGLRLRGARCLELGAGAGSIAVWLAAKVGPHGQVLATDLNPMPIPERPRLRVCQHDIVNQPVPEGPWDVIHARLLLQHLPQRRDVVDKLAVALAPGGALVVEDWDQTWRAGRVMHAPAVADTALFERFQNTLWAVFTAAGVDGGWASQVLAAMVDAGLVDVDAQIHARSWPGRSAYAQLVAGSIIQLADRLREHGLTDADLARVRELMADPAMVVRTPPMVSTVGYCPGGTREPGLRP